jgi:toxin ParE1/3/4
MLLWRKGPQSLQKKAIEVARLLYSIKAKRDVLDIMTFIARESGSQKTARAFIDVLRRKCSDLAALPGQMGRPRSELGSDIRSFAFRGYVIFFRYRDDVFEVIRIYEGHRDFESHFNK